MTSTKSELTQTTRSLGPTKPRLQQSRPQAPYLHQNATQSPLNPTVLYPTSSNSKGNVEQEAQHSQNLADLCEKLDSSNIRREVHRILSSSPVMRPINERLLFFPAYHNTSSYEGHEFRRMGHRLTKNFGWTSEIQSRTRRQGL